MMDYTDRHCRYLHRLYAPHALLYTEMIVAAAIVRGNAGRLLEHDAAEHPVALQLGGSDPAELAAAARLGAAAGYAEINLNVGCPSERVKQGSFGACLMAYPALVADCVRRMRDAVAVPVTVKCRIGIDDRDDYEFFSGFVEAVHSGGADAVIVHARKAILRGLSPKQNRQIPPLNYSFVQRLKREMPSLPLVINGGFAAVDAVTDQFAAGLDGVMLGRAVYERPALLAELERTLIDPKWQVPSPWQIIEGMVSYARQGMARGERLHAVSRHMHGLLAGREGARAWRRFLSDVAGRSNAVPESLYAARGIIESSPIA
ncbi:MAG: tRNA dihydrouridine(20/20a) synthase DusA [Steroidobacteraceae bacterium]